MMDALEFILGRRKFKQAFLYVFVLGNVVAVAAAYFLIFQLSKHAAGYKSLFSVVLIVFVFCYWLYSSLSVVACGLRDKDSYWGRVFAFCMAGHMGAGFYGVYYFTPSLIEYAGL